MPKPPAPKPGTPTPSSPQRKLSEVARHLVMPAGIVETDWPMVRDKAADLGVRFDRWQDGAGRCILGKRSDGLYAAGIGGVVISIPRQVGKTFTLGGIIFALCLLRPGLTVLWTSHQLRTTNETFRSMQGMARRKAVAPHIAPHGIRRANGDLGIEFNNGSRILFGAREMGFGLGFAKVDLIVFDEGQRLSEKALDDMLPTMNQAPNPLFFIVGTPPRPTDNGEVFSRRRAEAISDGLVGPRTSEDGDLLYIEISASPDAPRDRLDLAQVAIGNPSFPHRTPAAAVQRLWKNLGPVSFRREGYGIWDEADLQRAPLASLWPGLVTDEPPMRGKVALGVKFSLDGTRVAAAAARKPSDGPSHVEVLGVWPIAEGMRIISEWVTSGWRKLAAVVIDGKAGREALKGELRRAKVPELVLMLPTLDQVVAAHTTILTAAEDGMITHSNQAGLNASALAATQRKIGTAGGWGWEPIGDGDVLPLEAATLALYGAIASKRDPNRKTKAVVM